MVVTFGSPLYVFDSILPEGLKLCFSVLRAALMALTAIASCGEIAAMRIISPAKNQSGIEIIVKAMETNIINKDCCEEFCLFLDEMLEEPDIKGSGKTP